MLPQAAVKQVKPQRCADEQAFNLGERSDDCCKSQAITNGFSNSGFKLKAKDDVVIIRNRDYGRTAEDKPNPTTCKGYEQLKLGEHLELLPGHQAPEESIFCVECDGNPGTTKVLSAKKEGERRHTFTPIVRKRRYDS